MILSPPCHFYWIICFKRFSVHRTNSRLCLKIPSVFPLKKKCYPVFACFMRTWPNLYLQNMSISRHVFAAAGLSSYFYYLVSIRNRAYNRWIPGGYAARASPERDKHAARFLSRNRDARRTRMLRIRLWLTVRVNKSSDNRSDHRKE